MPVKFIDLDEINLPIGEAIIKGQSYKVYQMSVKSHINLIRLSDPSANKDRDMAAYMEESAEILHTIIPDCPIEVFMSLTIDQMHALLMWTRGLSDGEITKNESLPQQQETP
ncbi:MAG TPA: hypothetical protein VNP04_13610 [Alphaproteobacteria bacterium]|nr:hypothetical protein [Alphaproteobacteria bacterium]